MPQSDEVGPVGYTGADHQIEAIRQPGSPGSPLVRPVQQLGLVPSHGVYLWGEQAFLDALASSGITIDNRVASPIYYVRPGYGTSGEPPYLWRTMSWDEKFDRLIAERARADVYHRAMLREAGYDVDEPEARPKALLPERAAAFLRDESGLETVEVAIVAGLIVVGLALIVWAIREWVVGSLRELRAETAGGSP